MIQCVGKTEVASLARVVFRKAGAALEWLHSKGRCFVDLHPGNIALKNAKTMTKHRALIVDDETSVKLIDVAPIAPEGESLKEKRGCPKRQMEEESVACRKMDWMSLALIVAAILDFRSFRDSESENNISKTKLALSDLIMAVAKPLWDDRSSPSEERLREVARAFAKELDGARRCESMMLQCNALLRSAIMGDARGGAN